MLAMPGATPVTTPDEFTVAVAVALLLHVPPTVTLLRVVVAAGQTLAVPAIAAGAALTVTTSVL